jgi:hypothetical protein
MTKVVHPRPPSRILEAAKHGELVVFVGAGASVLCGSPNWVGFAAGVVNTLYEKGLLNFVEAEQLRKMTDPRRTLSIAMSLAKKNGIEPEFDKLLHGSPQKSEGEELYRVLSEMQPVFVTTNYDKWLHVARPGAAVAVPASASSATTGPTFGLPKYFLPDHLTPDRLTEKGAVIHLHGAYTVPSSMVVSLGDYLRHYADEKVQSFLQAMFKNYTVLFVGYGLAELEILEYIVRMKDVSVPGDGPRHFLLYSYRSNELKQTEYIEHYFREECGVEVIKYCIDNKGYGELVELFKSWRPLLDVRAPETLDLQARLDDFVATPIGPHREAAIHLVQEHPELVTYFMNILKSELWFTDLDGAGFFDVKHSPGLVTSPGREGYLQAPDWPAVRYLERIAPSLTAGTATRAAEIVRAITNDGQARGLENWRTYWTLATIFSSLPLEVIQDTDMKLVKFWVSSRFDGGTAGQELGSKLLPRLLDSETPADWARGKLLMEVLTELKPVKEAA